MNSVSSTHISLYAKVISKLYLQFVVVVLVAACSVANAGFLAQAPIATYAAAPIATYATAPIIRAAPIAYAVSSTHKSF
jgi:hypothetical protein